MSAAAPAMPAAHRCLPAERESVTRRIDVHGEHGSIVLYVTVGFYDDDSVGEIFVKASKKGSTLAGFASSWARMTSLALHRGVPWSDIYEAFNGERFEPAGPTHSDLGPVRSPIDAVVRFVENVRYRRVEKKKGLQSLR